MCLKVDTKPFTPVNNSVLGNTTSEDERPFRKKTKESTCVLEAERKRDLTLYDGCLQVSKRNIISKTRKVSRNLLHKTF